MKSKWYVIFTKSHLTTNIVTLLLEMVFFKYEQSFD